MKWLGDNLLSLLSVFISLLIFLFGPGVINKIPLPDPTLLAEWTRPIAGVFLGLVIGFWLGRAVSRRRLPPQIASSKKSAQKQTAEPEEQGFSGIIKHHWLQGAKWRRLDLVKYFNSSYKCPSAPRGQFNLADCDFFISGDYDETDRQFYPRGLLVIPGGGNAEEIKSIYVNENNVREVRLLLNAVNGFANFGEMPGQGKQIGNITLRFADGSLQHTPLRLGENISDWYAFNPASIHELRSEDAFDVWRDSNGDFVMNMLTIRLSRSARLDSIIVSAQLIQENNTTPFEPDVFKYYGGLPGVQVIAITCGLATTN